MSVYEFIIAMFEKSPAAAFILLGLVVYVVVFIAPRLRWDKNKKPYLYSRGYEYHKERQNAVVGAHKEVLARLDEHEKNDSEYRSEMREAVKTNKMELLKQSVYIDTMRPVERLYAGLRYIKAGGNGETRTYVQEELIAKHPDTYATIIAVHPNLKLEGGLP